MNSERIYQADDEQWYFSVRGNQARGPYPSFHDADTALGAHISRCRQRIDAPLWPRSLGPFKLGRQKSPEPRHP